MNSRVLGNQARVTNAALFVDGKVSRFANSSSGSRRATSARLWQILGTGFDHFDLEYARRKSFAIANCPGQFSGVALAETAMMLVLMLAHRYRQAAERFEGGLLYGPTGEELWGANLGIIGFGASGRELAHRARSFGMRILAIDKYPIPSPVLDELTPELVGGSGDLDEVVAQSDYLSLHLHLSEETHHLIDEKRLARMKPGACIINVARGALVDEEALADLPRLDGSLSDPESIESLQPEGATNPLRSIKPDIFVALGVCTHLGCSPTYRPEVAPADLGSKWKGGFFCACHGSRFDLAGRVYKGVPAPTNLEIPPHRYVGDHRIIVGEESNREIG